MIFENAYGIDLGNSSVKIYSALRNKSYSEKNVIAARGREIIAVGDDAYDMLEKEPLDISVKSPMAFGIIGDLELQEIVLYTFFKRINPINPIRFMGTNMFFTVPLDMTAVEKRAYYYVVNGRWLHQNRVYMVESPIADALSCGIDLNNNSGSMLVNMGSQSTELSIISGGKIIMSRKVPIGGKEMNEAICQEVRKRYHLQIGTRTAKRLKIVMGRMFDDKKEARRAVGIDSVSGLPREEIISSQVVNAGIANCVNDLAGEMKTFLERTPPQIAWHIAKEGIYLTGGSTRIPDMDRYLSSCTGVTFNLSDYFEASSLNGLERVIRDHTLRKYAVPIKERKL